MGKPVTVDSDDLEKVVMATGVVKQFEQIIKQHKTDPFVCHDPDTLTLAHNRLAAEMVRSKRGELHPQYDEPLSKDAVDRLFDIFSEIQRSEKYSVIDPAWMRPIGKPPKWFNELHQKGMIEIGSVFECVLWQSDPKQTREDKAEFRVRLTDRGTKLLSDIAMKKVSSIQ